jgi:ATP adenylyltransferase/5',5'''-P-1,P-4-tetraphosphate phosphorylase II
MFDGERVCVTFDDLVARKIILYGPETVVNISDKSFDVSIDSHEAAPLGAISLICISKFEFRLCPTLSTKPSRPDSTRDVAFAQLPKFGPGSDLVNADPGLIVTKVSGTHLLVLNRYCVFRPQYLILTLDSYKRQTETLDEADLSAAWLVLQSMKTDHFIMFNCGTEAGCSRFHKHMQVIPRPTEFTLFPDKEGLDSRAVPFMYYIKRLGGQGKTSADLSYSLLETYKSLCTEAQAAWQSSIEGTSEYFPHNMVLTQRWIMVFPRRKAEVQGAAANAAGMMGMVWVTNDNQMDHWKAFGPVKVLAELGIAR